MPWNHKNDPDLVWTVRENPKSRGAVRTVRRRTAKKAAAVVETPLLSHISREDFEGIRKRLQDLGVPHEIARNDEVIAALWSCEHLYEVAETFARFGRGTDQVEELFDALYVCFVRTLQTPYIVSILKASMRETFPDITDRGLRLLCTADPATLATEQEKRTNPLWIRAHGLPEDWYPRWLSKIYMIVRCGVVSREEPV